MWLLWLWLGLQLTDDFLSWRMEVYKKRLAKERKRMEGLQGELKNKIAICLAEWLGLKAEFNKYLNDCSYLEVVSPQVIEKMKDLQSQVNRKKAELDKLRQQRQLDLFDYGDDTK